MASFE
jgi:hypothetical protein